jgi:hypothetical protein
MTESNDTLGDALPREMARVRDEVMPAYLEIGPPGIFALTLMRFELDRATKALAEGDIATMIASYQELKGFKL